jgi:hypothetical protein
MSEVDAFCCRYDSKHDPANPKNWTSSRKTLITFLFGLTTMCTYLSPLPEILHSARLMCAIGLHRLDLRIFDLLTRFRLHLGRVLGLD